MAIHPGGVRGGAIVIFRRISSIVRPMNRTRIEDGKYYDNNNNNKIACVGRVHSRCGGERI